MSLMLRGAQGFKVQLEVGEFFISLHNVLGLRASLTARQASQLNLL